MSSCACPVPVGGAVHTSQTISGGALAILVGLVMAWLGLLAIRASRLYAPFPGSALQQPTSQLEARLLPGRPTSRLQMRLRGMAVLAIGVAMVGDGVTNLRDLHNHHVVPPSAPLLDQLIWLLTLTCLWSVPVLALALGWVRYVQHTWACRQAAVGARVRRAGRSVRCDL